MAAAGAAPRPTVVEMNTKKNTASAATAVGPGPSEDDDQAGGHGDPRGGVGDRREPGDAAPQRRHARRDERATKASDAADQQSSEGRPGGGLRARQ